MSFVVTVYVPEAIVMASDSRQFLTIEGTTGDGRPFKTETLSSDFAHKTFLLEPQRLGINAFGEIALAGVSIETHLRRFGEEHLSEDDDVSSVAGKLVEVLGQKFPNVDTAFHIAGFRKENGTSIPHVYYCHVGRRQVARKNVKPGTEEVVYGATWGGQGDIMARLLNSTHIRGDDGKPKQISVPPIIWDAMNVQDAIDFAVYAVRTTVDTMRFEARPKSVGGPIDVLAITPAGPSWIRRKQFHAPV